ncbi:MAG: DegT/DnrJ/EryC1/StrS family aminotransferase [Nitrososphaeria archaeon]
MKIPLMKPFVNDEIKNAVYNVLDNERFVLGESVYKFEEELAHYFDVDYAITVSSGTHALHFALLAINIKENDKVITTPFSFIATANAILYVGSEPIFADIKDDTLNIDPKEIVRKLSSTVKAILPVHIFGYPADMDDIIEIANKNSMKVIEDACQAHGATYNGKKVGSIGDVGCFSFYPSKNMTVCGDGGAVITNDDKIARTVIKLRDCGRISKYEHDIIGYTARLNTINAAIGRIQLKYLNQWNEIRRKIAKIYNKHLSDIEEIILPPLETQKVKPVYHMYVIRTKYREKLKRWLEEKGIECGIHYPIPIHLQPIYKKLYKYSEGHYPKSERVCKTCLSIPMHPFLKDEEIKYICEKIRDFYSTRSNLENG